jgi:hypothetical protein
MQQSHTLLKVYIKITYILDGCWFNRQYKENLYNLLYKVKRQLQLTVND